jgi:hypothetical protein
VGFFPFLMRKKTLAITAAALFAAVPFTGSATIPVIDYSADSGVLGKPWVPTCVRAARYRMIVEDYWKVLEATNHLRDALDRLSHGKEEK